MVGRFVSHDIADGGRSVETHSRACRHLKPRARAVFPHHQRFCHCAPVAGEKGTLLSLHRSTLPANLPAVHLLSGARYLCDLLALQRICRSSVGTLCTAPEDPQRGGCRLERIARAHNDQRVDRLVGIMDRSIRHEAQARKTGHGPRLFRDEPDVVDPTARLSICLLEHVAGTSKFERVAARRYEKAYKHRFLPNIGAPGALSRTGRGHLGVVSPAAALSG